MQPLEKLDLSRIYALVASDDRDRGICNGFALRLASFGQPFHDAGLLRRTVEDCHRERDQSRLFDTAEVRTNSRPTRK